MQLLVSVGRRDAIPIGMSEQQQRNAIVALADTARSNAIAGVLQELSVYTYVTDDGAEVLNRVTTLQSVNQETTVLVLGLQLKTLTGVQLSDLVGQRNPIPKILLLAGPSDLPILERIQPIPRTQVIKMAHSPEPLIDALTCMFPGKVSQEAKERLNRNWSCTKASESARELSGEAIAGGADLCYSCGKTIGHGDGRFRKPEGTHCVACHGSQPLAPSLCYVSTDRMQSRSVWMAASKGGNSTVNHTIGNGIEKLNRR